MPESFFSWIFNEQGVQPLSRKFFVTDIKSFFQKLVSAVWERRQEVSHKSAFGIGWNFPDSEKSKYMVNPEGVEILFHILEPVFPPLESVLGHFVPIVGRESP